MTPTNLFFIKIFFSILEGVSGSVFIGSYYGQNVAIKEIEEVKAFVREGHIIFGKVKVFIYVREGNIFQI